MGAQMNAAKLSVETTFFVTQRMLDSLQILQMDRMTLEKHIAEQLMENPVLNFPIINATRQKPEKEHHGIREQGERAQQTSYYETLEFFLADQLNRLSIAESTRQFCRKLVTLIDKNGYLPVSQLPDRYTQSRDFLQALSILQSLEPAGIAARDLKECLLLQLQRSGEGNTLAEILVRNHLEDISHRNHAKMLRITGVTMEELQSAIQTILTLNPRPGAAFSVREEVAYILPDFTLSCVDGKLTIVQEEQAFPTLSVSEYYLNLYDGTKDPEVKRYLKERITAAKHFVTGLENRKSTVLRCMEAIMQVQQGFFLNQSRQLVPLTLEEVAKMVDLHTSTVSRAVSGKYLEFDGKVYPLKFFFARGVSNAGERIATNQIRELIRQIVQNEDPGHPMSDQEIFRILQQGGCLVSRRTVAKYREQMGILSSKQRRKI